MFTRCPACHTLFRIQPKQLKAARGQVRCGSCQAVFDGLDFLVNQEELSREELAALAKSNEAASRQWQLPFDEAPTSAETTEPAESPPHKDEPPGEPAAQPAETPAAVAVAEAVPAPANPLEENEPAAPAEEPIEPAVESEPSPADTAEQPFKWSPRYTLSCHEPEATPPPMARRLGWAIGSLLLIAVLAGQLAWFHRDSLALEPHWRPWLQKVCDTIGCTLPPLRDLHAIEMVDRNVQSHPRYQGALLITATLVNQAPFAQPYPVVELAMTDLEQKRVAARRFLPAEYLDNGNTQGLIPPGASVRLKLEIADPGQEAVGFEFEFL